MATDELTWHDRETDFERDIDRRLAARLDDYAEYYPDVPRLSLRELETDVRALIAEGADINALGRDTEVPRERRRLVPSVFREAYYCYDQDEFASFIELLFSLGFDPDLDQGRAGAELLVSVARSVLNYDWAVSFPQAIALLLRKGCRADLSVHYEDIASYDRGDLDYHMAERAADMGYDFDYDSFTLLNTGRHLLREWKARRPTDGIGAFSEAFLSPIESVIVPPGATVTQKDDRSWEIRRKRTDDNWYTPSLGLRLQEKALLYLPQETLFCDTPPDAWQAIPLISDDLHGRAILGVEHIQFREPERIRLRLDKGVLFIRTRFESETDGVRDVITLTR